MDTVKPSLFSLTSEWENLFRAIVDEEVEEEEAFKVIDEIEEDIAEKADHCAAVITRLVSQEEMLKIESNRCKAMATQCKNASDRLREYLKNALLATGQSKLSTGLHKYTVRKNPLSVKVDNLETALKTAEENGYIKPHTLTEADIDKAAVKDALSNGEYLDGFHAEQGTSLMIK